jgi:hypothetical protein
MYCLKLSFDLLLFLFGSQEFKSAYSSHHIAVTYDLVCQILDIFGYNRIVRDDKLVKVRNELKKVAVEGTCLVPPRLLLHYYNKIQSNAANSSELLQNSEISCSSARLCDH